MIKAAIFGGSFDPPHRGHRAIAEKALEKLDIDKLIIVPAYLNPFKSSSLASPQKRLEWCRKVFGDIPGAEVSDFEISMGRPVYTAETLDHFGRIYDVKYIVTGSDNLSDIRKWREFDKLDSSIVWAIASRAGYPMDTGMLRESVILDIDEAASSTEIRERKTTEHIDEKIVDDVKKTIEGKK